MMICSGAKRAIALAQRSYSARIAGSSAGALARTMMMGEWATHVSIEGMSDPAGRYGVVRCLATGAAQGLSARPCRASAASVSLRQERQQSALQGTKKCGP